MFEYTLKQFDSTVNTLLDQIQKYYDLGNPHFVAVYGIPQGGIPLAIVLANILKIPLVTEFTFGQNILVVDDLIDSGTTIKKYNREAIAVLGHKPLSPLTSGIPLFTGGLLTQEWIHFWYEPPITVDPERLITRMLEYIGENPNRDGLLETPARVIKSFKRIYGGYKQDPVKVMKTFDEKEHDEMVILKDITLHSTCEHHMLPFSGVAHIAYIPNGRVLGVSKLVRVLEIFSRRLQIQERICDQVTAALMEHLKPLGAACVISARHSCMTARGVEQQSSLMVTSSLKGVFLDKPEVRAEFISMIKE